MNIQIVGVLKRINDTVQVSDKFTKREFDVEIDQDTQYPQVIRLQLSQTKVDLIDGYGAGNEITCYASLRGREWTDAQGVIKCFNTIDVWKIEGKKQYNKQESKPVNSTMGSDPQGSANDLPF